MSVGNLDQKAYPCGYRSNKANEQETKPDPHAPLHPAADPRGSVLCAVGWKVSWLSNLLSAPLRSVSTIVDAVDGEDILGISEASDNAAQDLKEAIERIMGED